MKCMALEEGPDPSGGFLRALNDSFQQDPEVRPDLPPDPDDRPFLGVVSDPADLSSFETEHQCSDLSLGHLENSSLENTRS